MTPEEAGRSQAYAAWCQVFLGLAIGWATWRFGRIANRLLKLQTEVQIEPAVSFTLHYPYAPGPGEPLAHVLIENHSPLELIGVTLSAEIFGIKGREFPTEKQPVIEHLGLLPNLGPQDNGVWGIDAVHEKAMEVMRIGEGDSSMIAGVPTTYVQFHLKFRRKVDGAPFCRKLLVAVNKQPAARPVAVYLDYHAQLQT